MIFYWIGLDWARWSRRVKRGDGMGWGRRLTSIVDLILDWLSQEIDDIDVTKLTAMDSVPFHFS